VRLLQDTVLSLSITISQDINSKSIINHSHVRHADFLGNKVSCNTSVTALVGTKVTAFVAVGMCAACNIGEDECTTTQDRVSYIVSELVLVISITTVVTWNDETSIGASNSMRVKHVHVGASAIGGEE